MYESTIRECDTPLYTPALDGNGDRFVPTLNGLLRGELAAVESYDQALEKYADGPGVAQLRQIRIEHSGAVRDLRNCIRSHGGEPTDSSGVWGVFAAAVTGTAKVISLKTLIAALRQGEEHGIADYEAFFEDDETAADAQRLIADQLLPKCKQHLATLDSIVVD